LLKKQQRPTAYWQQVAQSIPIWQTAASADSPAEIRQQSIAFHAITLNALALVGNQLYQEQQLEAVKALERVDFSVQRSDWDNLIHFGGRIVKNSESCRNLACYLYRKIKE
jgi:DNA-sulfur modification-associated